MGDGREAYSTRRHHFLKYIEHPEALTELAVDPLADDPEVSRGQSLRVVSDIIDET